MEQAEMMSPTRESLFRACKSPLKGVKLSPNNAGKRQLNGDIAQMKKKKAKRRSFGGWCLIKHFISFGQSFLY